jgi:hypothetical protein
MPTRTTHRAKDGDTLYATRDKQERFPDIQAPQRTHRQDVGAAARVERERKG